MNEEAIDRFVEWLWINLILDFSDDPELGTSTIHYNGSPIVEWDEDSGKESIIRNEESDKLIFMYLMSKLSSASLVASGPSVE